MSEAPVVFHFHPTTGEFVGTSDADPDPMEHGRWVVPASATLVAPTEPAAGFALVFADDAWQQVEDHRGETWWKGDGEAIVITFLGDPAAHFLSATPQEPAPVTSIMVNVERDRRIEAGFLFEGRRYAFDPDSKARVTGAATLAGFAVIAGAQVGDLFWQGEEVPFRFISNDNALNEMDAQTCFALGQAAAAHEAAHIFAARAIKDMDPIPADFALDHYWPLSAETED